MKDRLIKLEIDYPEEASSPVKQKTQADSKTERPESDLKGRIKNWIERQKQKNSAEWEYFFGTNLITRLGMLAMILAVIWFIKLAIDRHWINESVRVLIGILGGAGIGILGEILRRRGFKLISSIMTAGGVSIMGISVFSAWYFYNILGKNESFIVLVCLAVFSSVWAVVRKSELLYLAGSVGALILPALYSSGENGYRFLFIYLTFIIAGHSWVRRLRRFFTSAFLVPSIIQLTMFMWADSWLTDTNWWWPSAAVALLWLIPLLTESDIKEQKTGMPDWAYSFHIIIFTGTAMILAGILSNHHSPLINAHVQVLMTLLFIFFAKPFSKISAGWTRDIVISSSAIFLIFGLNDFFAGTYYTLSVGIISLYLYSEKKSGYWNLRDLSGAVLLLIVLGRIMDDNTQIRHLAYLNPVFISSLILSAGLFYISSIRKDNKIISIALFTVAFLTIILASITEIPYFAKGSAEKLLNTLTFLFYAVISVFYGFRSNVYKFRIAGLVLAGIAVLKFYLMDIWTMNLAMKVIAGFVLGGVLMLLGFYYEKLKSHFSGWIAKTVIILIFFSVFVTFTSKVSAESVNFSHFKYIRNLQTTVNTDNSAVYGRISPDEEIYKNSNGYDLRIAEAGKFLPWFRRSMEVGRVSRKLNVEIVFSADSRKGRIYVIKVPQIRDGEVITSVNYSSAEPTEADVSVQTGKTPNEFTDIGSFSVYRYNGTISTEIPLPEIQTKFIRLQFSNHLNYHIPNLTVSKGDKVRYHISVLKPGDAGIKWTPANNNGSENISQILFLNSGTRFISRISLKFSDTQYNRIITVKSQEKANGSHFVNVLTTRIKKSGSDVTHFITIPGQLSGKIAVEIQNSDDEPLHLTEAAAYLPEEEIIFRLPENWNPEQKLSLYYGDPYAGTPHYDILSVFDSSRMVADYKLEPKKNNEKYSFSLFYPPASSWIIRIAFWVLLLILALIIYKNHKFEKIVTSAG